MPGAPQPFRAPGDGDSDRARARIMFLRAIEHRAPQFIRDLEALSPRWVRVSVSYPGAIDLLALRQLTAILASETKSTHSKEARDASEAAKDLYDALLEWAEKRALHRDDRNDWILDVALKYLGTLDRSTGTAPAPFGAVASAWYWPPAPALAPPPYRPDDETWEQYIGSKRMALYRGEAEAAYAASGWARAPHRQEIERHLDWLLQFQIDGDCYAAIANDAGAHVVSVQREVRKVARLLGLKLRRDQEPDEDVSRPTPPNPAPVTDPAVVLYRSERAKRRNGLP